MTEEGTGRKAFPNHSSPSAKTRRWQLRRNSMCRSYRLSHYARNRYSRTTGRSLRCTNGSRAVPAVCFERSRSPNSATASLRTSTTARTISRRARWPTHSWEAAHHSSRPTASAATSWDSTSIQWPAWIVREEIEHLDVQAYRRKAAALVNALRMRIGDLYRTDCAHYGDIDLPVKYFLWVKGIDCESCGEHIDLFPGYLLSENSRHPNYVFRVPGLRRTQRSREPQAAWRVPPLQRRPEA